MDNSYYNNGKRMFLLGLPLPALPGRCYHSQTDCDIRSGWLVAQSCKNRPDPWPDAKIMKG